MALIETTTGMCNMSNGSARLLVSVVRSRQHTSLPNDRLLYLAAAADKEAKIKTHGECAVTQAGSQSHHGQWYSATYTVEDGIVLRLNFMRSLGLAGARSAHLIGNVFVQVRQGAAMRKLSLGGIETLGQRVSPSVVGCMDMLSLQEAMALGVEVPVATHRMYEPIRARNLLLTELLAEEKAPKQEQVFETIRDSVTGAGVKVPVRKHRVQLDLS